MKVNSTTMQYYKMLRPKSSKGQKAQRELINDDLNAERVMSTLILGIGLCMMCCPDKQ